VIEIFSAVFYFCVDSFSKLFLAGSLSLGKLVFVLLEVLGRLDLQAVACGNYVFEPQVNPDLFMFNGTTEVREFTGEVQVPPTPRVTTNRSRLDSAFYRSRIEVAES